MAPSTAMTPRARKRRRRQPTAPRRRRPPLRAEAMRRRLHLDQERLAERRAQRAAARAAAGGLIATGRRERPRAGLLSPLGSASPAAVQAHFEREQQAAPPLLPQSLARSPSLLPPPTSHLLPTCLPSSPRTPTHHTPHPPPPARSCSPSAARTPSAGGSCRAEARPRGGRRRGVHLNRARTCILPARPFRSSAPEASMSPKERRGDAAAEAELGDAAAEAGSVTPRGRRRRSRRMRPRVSTRSARRPRARGAPRSSVHWPRRRPLALCRSFSRSRSLAQIRGCRRIDDESRASARRQALPSSSKLRNAARALSRQSINFLLLPKQPTHTPLPPSDLMIQKRAFLLLLRE